VARAIEKARHGEVSQYYFGYLNDAVAKLEGVIMRLEHCDISQWDVADATDIAHRIKGNAAMYGYPELGLRAVKLETFLRADDDGSAHATVLLNLITFIDDIQNVCHAPGKPEPIGLHDTLAVKNEDQSSVYQDTALSSDRKSIIIGYKDPWLCELMASLLEPEFSVISCHTKKELHGVIDKRIGDLIILEDSFGGMSAVEWLKNFKGPSRMSDVPVFLTFDPDMPDSIAEAISLGVDGFSEDKHEILEIVNSAKTFLSKPEQCVLVVDDDPVVRELLKQVLKSAGLKVDTVQDGLEALDYLSRETPDIVLLDRFMPRLEGGTVLYEIQNKINLKSIPVLILTAMVNQGEAKSWFERGAADFIPKPFDPEEVVMRVKQHLETRQSAA